MLLESASWGVKEKNVVIIEKNNENMIRYICNVEIEESHERTLTESKIAIVWSSRKKVLGWQ